MTLMDDRPPKPHRFPRRQLLQQSKRLAGRVESPTADDQCECRTCARPSWKRSGGDVNVENGSETLYSSCDEDAYEQYESKHCYCFPLKIVRVLRRLPPRRHTEEFFANIQNVWTRVHCLRDSTGEVVCVTSSRNDNKCPKHFRSEFKCLLSHVTPWRYYNL